MIPPASQIRGHVQSRSGSVPPFEMFRRTFRRNVEFPRQLRPRPFIEFSYGLSPLLEDGVAVPLAIEFIAAFRNHLAGKGGRPC